MTFTIFTLTLTSTQELDDNIEQMKSTFRSFLKLKVQEDYKLYRAYLMLNFDSAPLE